MKKLVGVLVVIFGLLCVSWAMAVDYCWPLDLSLELDTITAGMYYSKGSYHGGTDISAPIGSEVYAIADGTVIVARDNGITGPDWNASYGNWIIIDHGNNIYSLYGHLSTGMFQVEEDQSVKQGQLIAYSGNAGKSTNPHLHLEIRMGGNTFGVDNVDPQDYLSKVNVDPVTTAELDVNTYINGENKVNPTDAGIIEVYINDQKWDDMYGYACDFCRTDIPVGSHYEIHYKPSARYWCDGLRSGSFTGTISEGKNVVDLNICSGSTSQPIPDGNYIIATVNHDAVADHFYFLDINGDDRTPALGQKVSIKEGSSTGDVHDYEAWTVSYSNGFYTIKQYTSSRVLDVYNRSVVSGDHICVSNPNNAGDDGNQRWRITPNDSYGYTLQAAHDGMCLNLDGMSVANKKVQQYPSDSSMAQGWMFIPYKPSQPVESGRYILVSALSDQAEMDVPNATNVPENQVVQIKKYGTLNQDNIFVVNKLDNGYYSIQHEKSGKGLDVLDGSSKIKQQLSLHTYNGTTTQQWAIIPNGNGKFLIVSRCNGYLIDVESSSTADGTKIQQYFRSAATNQQWKFVTPDDEAPVITEASESNVSETAATLSIKAIDNVGVARVEFYVRNENSPDSGPTIPAVLTDDTWTATVPIDLSNGSNWVVPGVYDAEGNQAKKADGSSAVVFGFKGLTLSFALDGGTCDEDSRQVIFTSFSFYDNEREFLTAYDQLPIPEKPGFEFAGWFDEEGNPVTEETLVSNREDHAIYAYWNVIDEEAPVVTNGVLTNITESSATVTVTATDNVGVDHVLVEVHPGLWKGTHPTTFEAQQVGDSWVCDFTFDFEESSMSRFFVDAYDVAGNKSYSTQTTSDVSGFFTRATVTYNANGGECDTANTEKIAACIDNRVAEEAAYPVFMGEMPVSTLENNIFLGWFDQTGSLITADSPVTSSQTLYAHWLKDYTNGKATINNDGNLVTVSYTAPCIVAESDDGETYSRVIPSEGDQGYEFQTLKSFVAVSFAADVDLNGYVNGNDYIAIKNNKSTSLTGIKAAVGDLNADEKINILDVAIFRRAFNVGLLHPAYQALSWYPLSPVYENTMTLPSALTTIEDESFAGIQAVNIVAPGTVTTIADDAFDDYVLLICPDDSYAAEFAEANNIPHMERLE